MATTRFIFQMGSLDRLHPAARSLFRWHLMEELEHRTVTFDVYEHAFGNYFYRLGVGLFAQWHLSQFVIGTIRCMIRTDPEAFRAQYGGTWPSFKRLLPFLWQVFRHLAPKLVKTYMPWYTPHKISMPDNAKAMAAEYTALAHSAQRNPEVKL